MANEETRKEFKTKLLAYKIEVKLTTVELKAKQIFKSLLKHNADQPFLSKALENKHYLEIVCYWIIEKKPVDAYTELKKVLRDHGLSNYCPDARDFEITPFQTFQDEETLSDDDRDKAYNHIIQNYTRRARYIGLFLLSCKDYMDIYESNSKQEELLDAIMEKVRQNYLPSLECLKALFNFILGSENFVKEIEGILSNAKNELSSNTSLVKNTAGSKLYEEKEEDKSNPPHGYDVMLSYQWDSQSFVKELKDFLKESGLTVWMDVEQMRGNILKRMQEGVNKSKVIVFCMTKKYELSINSRLEYNYAAKRKKIIIPVKLEDFQPSNELDIIIGNKFYYTFFNEGDVESTKVAFLKDIKKQIGKADDPN